MLVRNIKGTSRFKVPHGYKSWLDFWEKFRFKVAICASSGDDCCLNGTHKLVGAHVQKVNSTDEKYYIVPLCYSCNRREEPFNVDDDMLVPVPNNI